MIQFQEKIFKNEEMKQEVAKQILAYWWGSLVYLLIDLGDGYESTILSRLLKHLNKSNERRVTPRTIPSGIYQYWKYCKYLSVL